MARGYQGSRGGGVDAVWVRLRCRSCGRADSAGAGDSTSAVQGYLLRCGGIRPPVGGGRRPAGLAEREEISRGLAAGWSLRAIAAGLGRAPSTVSREVAGARRSWRVSGRGGGSAGVGTGARRKTCKLATRPGRRERGRELSRSGHRSRSPAG